MKPFYFPRTSGFSLLIAFMVIIFGNLNFAAAQCEIGAIEATSTPCDDLGYFNVIIDFEYANVGTQGFTIQGNGATYGTFEYADLPVTIYHLPGDGTTFYEFVVRDVEFPDCHNFIEFGTVDCGSGGDCHIWNVDVFPQPCENGFFYVHITFWHENVGNEGFHVQGNGNNYGNFEYADLPITIGPLEGDGITSYEFVVIDNQFEDCHDWAAIDPVDCGTAGNCHIWDLLVDDHPCVEGEFYCYVNFQHENVSDEGFSLYINDDLYGNFSYDALPLSEVGPLAGDGTTIYHFKAVDQVYEDCHDAVAFGPIDCGTGGDCHIWDVFADVMPCNEAGFFHVALDFEFANTGNEGFRVQGNGINYGNFSYDDIPVTIGPLEGNGVTVYEFAVIDNQFGDCHDFTAIDPVDCNPGGGDCEIGAIEATVLPCNDDNEFYVLLDFEYANTSDGFTVQGNGVFYGTFLYAHLPVEIGPLQGDGTTIYEFGVHDAVHTTCGNATAIDPVSCEGETALLNFTTQVMSCQDDVYYLKVDFNAINSGSQGFLLSGNGQDYGTFGYDQLPVEIGPLTTDGITPYFFVAKDAEFPVFGNWERLIPFTCENLGIEDMDPEEAVNIYPNPSTGSVTIETLPDKDVIVYLYNNTGSLIRVFSSAGKYQMDNLHPGIYYYGIIDDAGNQSKGKIMVTR